MLLKKGLLSIVLSSILLNAQSVDADMDGFDEPVEQVENSVESTTNTTNDDMDGFDDLSSSNATTIDNNSTKEVESFEYKSTIKEEDEEALFTGLSGKITQQLSYSWNNNSPHDNINSFKSSLFLDYEHKFENSMKFKVNIKAYYDSIYDIRGEEKYSSDELSELRSEIELFDAYLEGKILDNLDFKIGRQIVVWGRSDTIRVTDILNPIDNRRPGMIDIEDLRLPVTMAKFDYFVGDWRITPIAILEQRFSKSPPFGSDFYPVPLKKPEDKSYSDVNYALSVGGEFTGWDVNFYAAKTRDDAGYLDLNSKATWKHDKVTMVGSALNVLSGSWLFKSELAYFDGLKYSTTGDKEFKRTDLLFGVEYNGITDTLISYDISSRHIHSYNKRLLEEQNPLKKYDYQHALRVSSDFLNATIKANYLISLYGEKLDEGGFQRAWVKYDLLDGVNINLGVVDYIGGSKLFDSIKNNDLIFVDISYSF